MKRWTSNQQVERVNFAGGTLLIVVHIMEQLNTAGFGCSYHFTDVVGEKKSLGVKHS